MIDCIARTLTLQEQSSASENYLRRPSSTQSIRTQTTNPFVRLPALQEATNPFAARTLTPDLAPIAADGAEITLRLREQDITATSLRSSVLRLAV